MWQQIAADACLSLWLVFGLHLLFLLISEWWQNKDLNLE